MRPLDAPVDLAAVTRGSSNRSRAASPADAHIRPSEKSDIDFLLAHLRPEDDLECRAGGTSPGLALYHGFRVSAPCLTLLDPSTGDPAAMLGVAASPYECAGKIWLLGTPAIERYPTTFLRHSRTVLAQLYGPYTLVYNYTHCANELHHRWLKWLGFIFLRKVALTPDNYFYEFVRPRSDPDFERS